MIIGPGQTVRMKHPLPEKLVVYGARCVWWDSIDKVGKTPPDPDSGISIPCCPHCGSVLFEMPEAQWWDGADRFEREGHPGYRAMVEWWRGKCFPKLSDAVAAYKAATGIEVRYDRR